MLEGEFCITIQFGSISSPSIIPTNSIKPWSHWIIGIRRISRLPLCPWGQSFMKEYVILTNTLTRYSSGAGRLLLMTCVSRFLWVSPRPSGHTATDVAPHIPPVDCHYRENSPFNLILCIFILILTVFVLCWSVFLAVHGSVWYLQLSISTLTLTGYSYGGSQFSSPGATASVWPTHSNRTSTEITYYHYCLMASRNMRYIPLSSTSFFLGVIYMNWAVHMQKIKGQEFNRKFTSL